MKKLSFLLVLLTIGCTKESMQPVADTGPTLESLISEYRLQTAAPNDSSLELTVPQLERLLASPRTVTRSLDQGARAIQGSNQANVDISLIDSVYAVVVRVTVDYLFCSERNNFLAVTDLRSKLRKKSRCFQWEVKRDSLLVPEQYAIVTDSTIDYGLTGILTYRLKVGSRYFTYADPVGIGGTITNEEIPSLPTGEPCFFVPQPPPEDEEGDY